MLLAQGGTNGPLTARTNRETSAVLSAGVALETCEARVLRDGVEPVLGAALGR